MIISVCFLKPHHPAGIYLSENIVTLNLIKCFTHSISILLILRSANTFKSSDHAHDAYFAAAAADLFWITGSTRGKNAERLKRLR